MVNRFACDTGNLGLVHSSGPTCGRVNLSYHTAQQPLTTTASLILNANPDVVVQSNNRYQVCARFGPACGHHSVA